MEHVQLEVLIEHPSRNTMRPLYILLKLKVEVWAKDRECEGIQDSIKYYHFKIVLSHSGHTGSLLEDT